MLQQSSRGPKGHQAEPHTHRNLSTAFLMVSWLAVLLKGAFDAVAQFHNNFILIIIIIIIIIIISTGILMPNMVAILHLQLIAYIANVGHLCYGQLTPVKTSYPLTSIMRGYCRLKFRSHRGQLFFFIFF